MTDWQLQTPVVLLIFNRPDTTERVFETIRQVKPPKLLVVADGPRADQPGEAEKCAAVRAILDLVDWDCQVIKNYADTNLGCRERVSSGLNWVFETVEEAIILEDDCLPHPTFFRFCEELLERYRHDDRIMAISGDNFQLGRQPIESSYYFSSYMHIWGWATWRRAWQFYDLEMTEWPQVRETHEFGNRQQSKVAARYWSRVFQNAYEGFNTWDYAWVFACWSQNGLIILPSVNLVSNIGFREDATHTKVVTPFTNLKVEEMTFPLIHPTSVSQNIAADSFTEKNMYSGDSQPIQFSPKQAGHQSPTSKLELCKICGSISNYFDRARLLQKYEVNYFQCSNCGFVQTEKPYWLEEAYSSAIASSDVGLVMRNQMFSKIVSNLLLNLFDSGGKCLDYGGGYGLFVRLMRDAGFDFYWEDRYASNLLARGFEASEAGTQTFELVTAFELFEHFVDPIPEIERLLSFSRNILFSTELLPSQNPKINQWWYYATHEGQHIALYTPKALSIIAKKFNLNLYSNGANLHLLTVKNISASIFEKVIRYQPPASPRPSLIPQDYQAAIAKINQTRPSITQDLKPAALTKKKQVTVLFDAVFFQLYQTGIARLWRSLLEEWATEDFARQIFVLDRGETAPQIPGLQYIDAPRYDYSNTEADRKMLQDICDENEIDVFVSSYYTTPTTTPSVFMAYDMIPEIAGYDPNNPMWREKKYGLEYGTAYIAISESTARDLTRFFPQISKDSITVAHCGVNPIFSPASLEELERFKSQHNISKPYFMLVGMRVGYKNAGLFFQAFSKLENQAEFEVVCTGGGSQLEEEFQTYVGNTKVHMLQLSDEDLSAAYSGATALAFPSQYEGFGLPVLEAMACGCPVITCRKSSIPEVGGDAVIYIGERDVEGMLNALREVQKPESRNAFVSAGLDRAKQFSWSKMACRVKEALIQTALQSNSPSHQFLEIPAPNPELLATQIQQYLANPSQAAIVQALCQSRQKLAEYWLGLSAEKVEAAYTGAIGKVHRQLWNSGFKNVSLTESEKRLTAQIAATVARGFDAPEAIRALLAATLYFYPHQLEIKYQRAPIPNWFAQDYLAFMFESPRLFKEVGEVDGYYHYLTQWLIYLSNNIKNNPDNPVWNSVTSTYVNSANLTPLYFSANPSPEITLKQIETDRADIVERYLKQNGYQLDYTFSDRPTHRSKIRLGILCQNFYPSAETFTGLPIFEHLDRTRFEVYLYSLATVDAAAEQFVRDRADKCVDLAGNELNPAVQTIRADDLDILFIGSNITARSYPITLLSLHRLARIQTVSLAQPVTTGMRHIDYYIAGTLSIPAANPQSYYREKLVTVEGSGLCFRFGSERPATIDPDRASWGATPQTTVFISGANCRKLNPEVRHTWAKILAATPNSILVLYPFGPNWGRHPQLEKPFYDGMKAVFAQYGIDAKRLVLIRTLPSPADIRKCLELADVYLDSYPYSGAASALDPLRVNLPLVVMEGEELRCRQSTSLLRELQIPDLIARNEEEYVRLAVSLGTNPQRRQQKRQQIQQQMQQSPPFLDSRAYGEKMGALFEGLFESMVRGTVESVIASPVSSYDSIKHAVDAIEGFLVPGQEKYLFDKVKSMPEDATIVEIGSFQGRSTVAMAYACVGTNRKIYCIDPWNFKGSKLFPENIFEIWTDNIQNNRLDSYVTPLQGYSRDILSRWSELVGNQKIDFIFIDGGHEYEDVLPDFQLAFPLVKPGGWIALHDVRAGFPGVDRVWVENARVALTRHEGCSTIACGQKPEIAPTQPSSEVSPPDLNRLLGCVNLYEIDPSNTSIASELSQLRRQLAEYFLSRPTAELETIYKGELGNVYQAFLKSGFQTQPIPESDRPFVGQLTQQGTGFVHPQALNAFLGAMLYYAPGTMKVQEARTRLPGWLIEDYEGVFGAD